MSSPTFIAFVGRLGHACLVSYRPLTENERQLLQCLLSQDFDGVEALRRQLDHALVTSSCSCGCGSLGFAFPDAPQLEPSDATSPLPVEADVVGPSGTIVGGVIVFLKSGFLDDVDVYSFTRDPLPLPRLENVQWRRQRQDP